MANRMVRVSEGTHEVLKSLADQADESMQAVLDRAVEEYRRQHLLELANDGYAKLRANAAAWKDEQRERATWDRALNDHLESE